MAKPVMKWLSFDKLEFFTESECRSHERKFAHKRLVGLTPVEVDEALSGANADLADAIELVAGRIARGRKSPRRQGPTEPTPAEVGVAKAESEVERVRNTVAEQQAAEDAVVEAFDAAAVLGEGEDEDRQGYDDSPEAEAGIWDETSGEYRRAAQ